MALGAGAAVDVDLVVGDVESVHGQQGDHCEGLVDLEQVDVLDRPVELLHQLVDGAHRGDGEFAGVLGVGAVAQHARQGLGAEAIRCCLAGQDQRRGAVGDGAGVGRGDGALLGEGGAQRADLVQLGLEGLLVVVHHGFALAGGDGDRGHLGIQVAGVGGRHGALQRRDGKVVQALAAVVAGGGDVLGEDPHQLAGLGVLEAVQEHMVLELAVAEAIAGTRLGEHVGGIGHGLHAAGQHHLGAAGADQVVGQHGGLHAGAAQLVDGGGADAIGDAGLAHGLAGRALLDAAGQHAAQDALVDAGCLDAGTLDGGADGNGGQLRRGHAREAAEHAAHGGAGGGEEDDIAGVTHGGSPGVALRGGVGRIVIVGCPLAR